MLYSNQTHELNYLPCEIFRALLPFDVLGLLKFLRSLR